MESGLHTLENLFQQLGLASDTASIETFISTHSPIPADTPLSEAAFWLPAQAQFLKEEILDDADWSHVIDQLNNRLHRG
ncbi:DUF2789 domain-containing protein [Leeia oryzae]|uniref:DUF2789 domain-containing protein n=1 Tax=Leeia oryzae TaxID=356662 RepID=UPI00036F17D0|nr:DUF2789 domain-containing protein [Leeia oryzae]